MSIWDTFLNQKRRIIKKNNANLANNFYQRYRQDLNLIREMNCNHFRFSLAWSRILPNGIKDVNAQGIDFYDRLIDESLNLGIEPWVTLYHWDLPQALQEKGGWTNRDVIFWFEEYAEICVKKFGDRVKNWMVLNEPLAFTALGHFLGVHAPGIRSFKKFLSSVHHAAMVNAHIGRLIKDLLSNSYLGTTFSFSPVHIMKDSFRNRQAQKRVDALLNRLFLDPLLGNGYPLESLVSFKPIEQFYHEGDIEKLQFSYDFIGVQNYSREFIKHSYFAPYIRAKLVSAKKRKVNLTAMGWENYPYSVAEIIKRLNKYNNIPDLIITESGIAFEESEELVNRVNDNNRIEYYTKVLKDLEEIIKHNNNLRGFFAWTNTDNFEWAEGYRPKFGLISIDRESQKRIPKLSYYWFQEFLK